VSLISTSYEPENKVRQFINGSSFIHDKIDGFQTVVAQHELAARKYSLSLSKINKLPF